MNLLDRLIASVAPSTGLRRAAARLQLDAIRSYDAAGMGRRTGNWVGARGSANAMTRRGADRIRWRARDVVRNTWWAPRIVSVFTSHAIGTGITPVSKIGNRALDRKVQKLWQEWGAACDMEGQLDVNGLMALACGTIVEAGEVLIRFDRARRADLKVPLRLALLEPEQIDSGRDRFGPDDFVDQGIQYDADGRRTGYWLFPTSPSLHDVAPPLSSNLVPAASVLHVYRKARIGQGRGVSWFAPIILKGHDVADLEEAITVKARVEACLALLIKSDNPATTLGGAHFEKGKDGAADRRIETLSPAMIKYLSAGESAEVVNPSSSLAFESVLLNTWMTLAAGAGITYDQMTGDLRQANYSSLRAGKIEFRRLVEQFQWLCLVPMLLDPLWREFTAWAQQSGALPVRAGGYPVEWIMPAVEPIDPQKDLEADINAVRAGRMTWPQFVAGWGFDPDEQLDQIAEWQTRIDEKKIVLDTDARRPRNGGTPPKQEGDDGQTASKDAAKAT